MLSGCPERFRLEQIVAAAVSAVYKLKNQEQEARNIATSAWLDEARSVQRHALHVLRRHIKEHRCERLK